MKAKANNNNSHNTNVNETGNYRNELFLLFLNPPPPHVLKSVVPMSFKDYGSDTLEKQHLQQAGNSWLWDGFWLKNQLQNQHQLQ